MPAPFRVRALVFVKMVPLRSRAAPANTVAAPMLPPSAVALPNLSVPTLIAVPPVKVFAPVSVSVPVPDLVRLPEPEIMPLYEMLSDRWKASAPLFVMLPVTEPEVPPLPI